ncbi:MAG: YihY/virulence factor BrkB family protein, partial [Chloroflexia bacterium]|nr:YihY/virulence factor BrkB family protein [Chloroflexia bacterium]
METSAGVYRSGVAFLKRFVRDVRSRRLTGMSQQIAYNILFALGPLLMFVTAFCGFVTQRLNAGSANPVKPVTDWLSANLPREAAQFLEEPVANALTTSPDFLLSFGGLVALIGARGAMGAIMEGLNEAYGVRETRSWVIRTGTAVGLTVALAVALIVSATALILSSEAGRDIA